jgi:glucan biosynthesis protein C
MPDSIGNTWSLVALAMGAFVYPAIMIAGGAFDGNFDAYTGGLTWQAIAMAAAEMFTGIGLCLGLLVWYRNGYASQSKWSKLLSDNSFTIYVFHAPILVGIALLLAATGLPVLAKFALVFSVGLAATLGLSLILRCVPILKKVL